MDFHSFNFHDDLMEGVLSMGYKQPTPVQEQAIPIIMQDKDLIACAQTGTGKTAAYLLPLLDKISHGQHNHTSTLILVPTRELAKQIDDQIEGFAYFVSAQSIAIYGGGKGDDWDTQKRALTGGADIIVATPGRLISHMNLGYVKFDQLDYLVLDEADKMLDMGFMDDLLKIIRYLPEKRQTLMFSATMPPKIRDLAKQILKQPEEISLAISKPAAGIDQRVYLTYDNQKLKLLQHLIQNLDIQSMIIFTSRKSGVGEIQRALQKMGFNAQGIMSDLTQEERERVLQGFRNKQFPILVATDIVSRGIDIENISHILNYDVPQDAEDYIHRIGRTARAATTGVAITFVNENDMDRFGRVEKMIERVLDKLPLPEELGPGPEYDPRGGRGGGFSGRGGRSGPGGSRRPQSGGGGGRSGGGDRSRGGRPQGERPRGERTQTDRPVQAIQGNGAPATEGAENREGSGNRNRNRNRPRDNRPAPDPDRPKVAAKPRPASGGASPAPSSSAE